MNMQFFTNKERKCIRTFFNCSPAMHPITIRHPVHFPNGMRSAAVSATPSAGAEMPSKASKAAFPSVQMLCGIDFPQEVHRDAFYFCKSGKMHRQWGMHLATLPHPTPCILPLMPC